MHAFIHTDEVQEYRHAYVRFRLKKLAAASVKIFIPP